MSKVWPVLIAFAVLAACTSSPNLNSSPSTSVSIPKTKQALQAFGMLELTVDDSGIATAETHDFAKPTSGNLGAQSASVFYPGVIKVKAVTSPTSVVSADGNYKFITNVFEISLNNGAPTNSNIANVMFLGVNKPGTTIGGTNISAITGRDVAATPITDLTIARAMTPAHGMAAGPVVDSTYADMQYLAPDEIEDLKSHVNWPNQNFVPLEYGFLAHALNSNGTVNRNQVAIYGSGTGSCVTYACKGQVAITYKVPFSGPLANQPKKYTMSFIYLGNVSTNQYPTYAISQSLEEQADGTVAGLPPAATSSFTELRTLGGTTLHGSKINPICGVATAISGGTKLAFLGTKPVSGELDTCFATGGVRERYNFSVTCPFVYGLLDSLANPVVQSDGKIIMFGGSTGRFGVVRLNRDGGVDESFGTGGCARTGLPGSSSRYPYSAVIQPDGKIVVVGLVSNGGIYDWMLARFKTDGTLDDTFDGPNGNGNGQFEYNFGASEYASKVMLQTISGVTKLVVAGTSGTSGYGDHYTLVRLSMTDGSFDTSFNGTGINAEFIGGDLPNAAMDSSGRVVTAGYNLVRYNVNGTIDSSFGTNPVVSLGNATQSIDFTTIGGVEKIYAASAAYLYRLNSNASLDNTFNNPNGFVCYYNCNNYQVSDVKVQSNNRVLLTLSNGQIRRLFADGSPDIAFGVNGISSSLSGGGLTLQNDGKFLNVGNDPTVGLSVSRFNP
jgi:uncharacterized delta-60 repeat protein